MQKTCIRPESTAKKKIGGMSDSNSLLEEEVHTPHPATEPTINN